MNVYQENVKSCNFCGSEEYKVLHHFPAGFYGHNAFETYPWDGATNSSLTIVKCRKCSLIYQNPRFKEEYLSCLYTQDAVDFIDMQKELVRHKFGPLLSLIEKTVLKKSNYPLSLDVGTRYGLLPELLRRKGYNAHGIEFNSIVVDAASRSGINNVHCGTIDTLNEIMNRIGESRINLITMTDVIEHLLDPMADLKKLSEFQESGDYIIVQTVNAGSWGHRLFGKWWYHFHAQHTYYFDEPMLRRFFERNGYEISSILKVAPWRNITLLTKVWSDFRNHKSELVRLNSGGELSEKVWFAKGKPTLFDIITVVAKKR